MSDSKALSFLRCIVFCFLYHVCPFCRSRTGHVSHLSFTVAAILMSKGHLDEKCKGQFTHTVIWSFTYHAPLDGPRAKSGSSAQSLGVPAYCCRRDQIYTIVTTDNDKNKKNSSNCQSY